MKLADARVGRMRVAVISYHSSPLAEPGYGDAGGMTVYVREVAARLARAGVRTDIFTRATEDLPRVVEISPHVRVIAIEAGPRRPLAKDRTPDHIESCVRGVCHYAAAERLRYDILHSHYWQSGLAATALARLWHVPLVHSHHTLGRVKNRHLPPGDRPESTRRLRGEDDVIRAADVLITSTDDEWEQLSSLYAAPHDRLKTIHPGVDHRTFSPGERAEARRSLGLGGEAVLLAVGRVQPLKGLDLAIRAAEQLRPAFTSGLSVLIVGGASGAQGPDELRRLRALTERLDLDDVVRFEGPVAHTSLPAYYRAADALVVCSYSESFGLTALEAHACGTPVVGTAVGGLSYIVEDGESGYLTDSRDPAVFAAYLKDLVGDEQKRRSFGRRAVASAARFSWERTSTALETLYDCVLAERLPEARTC